MQTKRSNLKHFNVQKLQKQKKLQKIGIGLLIIFLIVLIYASLFPTFILFVILSWLGLITSFLIILSSTGQIRQQNKSKWQIICLIRDNYTSDTLELAKRVEYPYSILKEIINYLESQNERFF